MANALQQLSTAVQNLTVQRRPQEQEEDGSVHGIPRLRVTPTRTYERPTRPIFARRDLVDGNMEEGQGDMVFTDNIMALHDEWEALPQRVQDHLNIDRFMSQKREHGKN